MKPKRIADAFEREGHFADGLGVKCLISGRTLVATGNTLPSRSTLMQLAGNVGLNGRKVRLRFRHLKQQVML
jgi:hypothetical protein